MTLPAHLRDFSDMDTARNWMYEGTEAALGSKFPIEDDMHRLELSDVQIDRKDYTMQQQKDALMKDRNLHVPVKGTWNLVDRETGNVLDSRRDTIMNLPYLTERGTIINKGNEYSGVSQSRLKPGAYTRVKRSGEPETLFNVRPRTGRVFRMWMQPETGIFKVNVGQSNIPAYSLLKAMGTTDEEMSKAWGPELAMANTKAAKKQDLDKFYARIAGNKADMNFGSERKAREISEILAKAELDPDVMARTLGMADANNVSKGVLLRAATKLLNVSRGAEDPDDRDAPKYSNILSIEDHIPERVEKDAGNLARNLLWKVRRDRTLKRMPAGALSPYTEGYMFGSRLAMPLEETNPLALLEQMHRVTKLGEGGIAGAESITDEARDVNIGQAGFIDPIVGPESMGVGIDVRTAFNTYKGRDKQMYAEFLDSRTGDKVYLKPEDLDAKVLAFPGGMGKPGDSVVAISNGEVGEVPKKAVDYAIPSMAHMLSPHAILNPMSTGMQPARAFYGAKFWSQYLPQAEGETPLVDTAMPDSDESASRYYGRKMGTVSSSVSGEIVSVDDDKVVIKDSAGEKHTTGLVKNFPFNRMSAISYTPSVKPGDRVEQGQMLAYSNFTNKEGDLALGRNLRTAVTPYLGKSFEDAYVISDSAARKMSTERLYGYDREARHGVQLGRGRYASLFPDKFDKKQLEKIDDEGIALPGAVLEKGDPVILATGPKLLGPEDLQLGRLHKALRNAHTDRAVVWQHDYPGKVVDAARTRSGAKVNVSAIVPVQTGDKLSSRYGLKGVVGEIVADEDMPRDIGTNQPFEMLFNPMGVLSRVAPAQIAEMALAKVAKQTGKSMKLPLEPPEEGWAQWGLNVMRENGVEETVDLFDPKLKRTIKNVADGYVYTMAFHHLGEKKLSNRGSSGVAYTADEQPARGGGEFARAKKMSSMDQMALLAHGATGVLRDAQTIRGTRNDEYWKALKLGMPLPEPEVPFIYDKFLNTLKAGGVNISKKGDTMSLLPMTDAAVEQLSRGAVKNGGIVDDKLAPIPGGLFDLGVTGGIPGRYWSHVNLVEPVPNPVFEEPIRRMLGLKQKELAAVLSGEQEIEGDTGGRALKKALSKIDLDTAEAEARGDIRNRRGAARDDAVKRLGYVLATKKQGLHPADWIISKVPILPPRFRPVSQMGDVTLQADLNELYRDLVESNNALKDLRKDLPESQLGEERMNLYKSVGAAFGLGEPITPEGRSRRLKGAIRQIIGDSPKHGMFQERVLAKQVDAVGRGVVTPDPNLDMDSLGIPEESAWTLYKDFVVRDLSRRNIPMPRVLEMVRERDPSAREALDKVMAQRPILLDRAPTWHKFNLMAFNPHISEGSTIRVSPLITAGFGMDFDGDAVNFHVPVSDDAVSDAKNRMMPSSNLFSLTDLKSARYTPQKEMGLGLYQLTLPPRGDREVKRFPNHGAAVKAWNAGDIDTNDPIEIR